jgi:hypothetical protein
MTNLAIWNNLSRPPIEALKKIGGGRLSGKTDINPQWRYKAMTEEFGLCGVGWKFTIDKLWTEPGNHGVMMCFAQVSVYVAVESRGETNWSEPIPGIGGSQLVQEEKSGFYSNDEGYKMAVTDALSVALKMLGVAADIYLGNFDGSKYKTPSPEEMEQRAETSKAIQEKHYASAMAILGPASDQGTDALKLAWEKLAKDGKLAVKENMAELKERAAQVDVEEGRDGVV